VYHWWAWATANEFRASNNFLLFKAVNLKLYLSIELGIPKILCFFTFGFRHFWPENDVKMTLRNHTYERESHDDSKTENTSARCLSNQKLQSFVFEINRHF